MTADLFVQGARVVKPDAFVECGLAMPGLLDTHLHLGTADQSFADDCASESRQAVTGGVTTLLPFVITQQPRGRYLGRWS